VLEAARSGAEDKLTALLNPLNVNCHASDGRRSTPLHLAAGYNRIRVVQLLLQLGADVHAKDKGYLDSIFCAFPRLIDSDIEGNEFVF
jgi:tankyrase